MSSHRYRVEVGWVFVLFSTTFEIRRYSALDERLRALEVDWRNENIDEVLVQAQELVLERKGDQRLSVR